MAERVNDLYEKVQREQRVFCAEQGAQYVASPPESRLGFAMSTKGKVPINGLRHPEENGTCGWYIWYGEMFSDDSDFFSPLCVGHTYADHPELRKFLGLAPGYRFLLAGEHSDVWYDAGLLNV